jgi:hypothetical protein
MLLLTQLILTEPAPMRQYTDPQLQAYLDETLSSSTMAEIEQALRESPVLRDRLVAIVATREAGVHGLGEIWRRHRVSCPSREQLGSYLLRAMDNAQLDYIQFHLEVIQCRFCLANLEDLKQQSIEQSTLTQSRRRKYFQTSAGFLSDPQKRKR